MWGGEDIPSSFPEHLIEHNMNITETYQNAVIAAVKKTNHSAWGADESVEVIEKIVDAAYLGDEPEGFDAVRGLVKELVNASAFRQKLEKLPSTHPCHIKPSGNKRGASSALAALKDLKA